MNRAVKYKKLYGVNVDDLVMNTKYHKNDRLKHTLMSIKTKSRGNLFVGVENRRSGFHKNTVFVLFYSSNRRNVEQWLDKEWGKNMFVEGYNEEENDHSYLPPLAAV